MPCHLVDFALSSLDYKDFTQNPYLGSFEEEEVITSASGTSGRCERCPEGVVGPMNSSKLRHAIPSGRFYSITSSL